MVFSAEERQLIPNKSAPGQRMQCATDKLAIISFRLRYSTYYFISLGGIRLLAEDKLDLIHYRTFRTNNSSLCDRNPSRSRFSPQSAARTGVKYIVSLARLTSKHKMSRIWQTLRTSSWSSAHFSGMRYIWLQLLRRNWSDSSNRNLIWLTWSTLSTYTRVIRIPSDSRLFEKREKMRSFSLILFTPINFQFYRFVIATRAWQLPRMNTLF